ncbi:hypothetical protein [Streptomyces sp. NPDC001401]|uniref:hypothetical protein n=1 Tax=Streptomyces sp. NPDC001401 TaxID=3364570 RepID=UPI003677BD98
MGERQSDGSARSRRRVHPDGMTAGAEVGPAGPVLEILLAAAMRENALDAEGEQRAVAAFRAARAAGVHRARTRRRDDWRPREQRRMRRSLKATLTMALASLTLGGVAVAAIGSVGSSDDDHGSSQQHPSAGASGNTAGGSSASGTPGASGTRERPDTAKDTEAHCRAYENVKGNGNALDSTAWQRLITAAGGEKNVAAYCAAQLAQATATGNPGNSGKSDNAGKGGSTENPSNSNGSGGSGGSGGTDTSGSASGNGQKADKTTGKGN